MNWSLMAAVSRSLFDAVGFLQVRPFKVLGLQQVAIGGLEKKVVQIWYLSDVFDTDTKSTFESFGCHARVLSGCWSYNTC